ncbi:MAG TPA: anthranilate synthase component I family protein [Methanospirillum sp.]|nr:anthranilate synthase component I family protein [Methanospirillum sp.]
MYIHDSDITNRECGDAGGLEIAVTANSPSPVPPFEIFARTASETSGTVIIPVTLTIPIPGVSPADLYHHLRQPQGFLLESMEGIPRRAVRSIIGCGQQEIFSLNGDEDGNAGPLDLIREYMAQSPLSGQAEHGFTGGLVGYCSYDMVSTLHKGRLESGKEETCPLVRFMRASVGIVLDHPAGTCTIFSSPRVSQGEDLKDIYCRASEEVLLIAARIGEVTQREQLELSDSTLDIPVVPLMNQGEYEEAVRTTLGHIRAGDIFQAVISQRFEAPYAGDPFNIYREVRDLNPSPYLYFLEFGDETIIGSSPEMLVKVDGDALFTVPIAGTRPRGRDPAEDKRLADEMLADEKERAEHLMLVDLARNDIGKVAAFGSVQVPSFMEVEKFSHVQHLTSLVTGEINDECDRFDALASCFPAGTVSGAPKLRAMQIIAEMEPHPRGLYAGAVGYIGFDDRLEFAIAIRTMIVRDGIARIQAGAGIVADSDPTREYEETRQKAGALLSALNRASRRLA